MSCARGDYCARQKIGRTHLNYGYFQQLPVLPPDTYAQPCVWLANSQTLKEWFLSRILKLTYTAWDLEPFARDCSYSRPPFTWDEQRRFLLRCELDAAFFRLYLGTQEGWANEPQTLRHSFPEPHDAVAYIMGTFPIIRRKDEQLFGSYRTKETLLEIYDAMAEATRAGQQYESRGR